MSSENKSIKNLYFIYAKSPIDVKLKLQKYCPNLKKSIIICEEPFRPFDETKSIHCNGQMHKYKTFGAYFNTTLYEFTIQHINKMRVLEILKKSNNKVTIFYTIDQLINY